MRRSPSCTDRRSDAARAYRSATPQPAASSGSATFSSAVCPISRWNRWNTNPMVASRSLVSVRSSTSPTSRPSMHTVPAEARSSRPKSCRRVLLPEPDGPTTATRSPGRIVSDTSRNASMRADPSPYHRLTWLRSSRTPRPDRWRRASGAARSRISQDLHRVNTGGDARRHEACRDAHQRRDHKEGDEERRISDVHVL